MRYVGFIRFSLLGFSDWQFHRGAWRDFDTNGVNWSILDTVAERLFDPDRLQKRFAYFERICLPSIRAQTNQNFEIFVLTSIELPPWALERLHAAVADIPNVKIIVQERGVLFQQVIALLEDITAAGTEKICHFRLDDDDGLARDYIHNLTWVAEGMKRFSPAAISFGTNYHICLNHDPMKFLWSGRAFNSLGLAMVSANPKLNVYRWGHFSVIHRMKSFYDAQTVNGVMLRHDDNDSKALPETEEALLANGFRAWENHSEWLAEHFPNLDLAELSAL